MSFARSCLPYYFFLMHQSIFRKVTLNRRATNLHILESVADSCCNLGPSQTRSVCLKYQPILQKMMLSRRWLMLRQARTQSQVFIIEIAEWESFVDTSRAPPFP